jgi:ADP-heptose:LPS heptosyltransferase
LRSFHINSRRILIARGGALGDFILTLPAIHALRDAFPDAEINVLANKAIAPLAREAVEINGIRSLDDPDLGPVFIRGGDLSKKWRGYFRQHDLVISYLHDPEKVFEINLRELGVARLVAGLSKVAAAGPHAAIQLAEPLLELGIAISNFAPRVQISQRAREKARQKLGPLALIALHPGSGSPRKNWPMENWIALIAYLIERNVPVTIIGGEADRSRIVELQNRFKNEGVAFAIDWPLRDLAALLAGLIFVGHDSGISHLAAATGAASLVLFGPTDPQIWAPLNENARVLLAPNCELAQLPFATLRDVINQELMRIGIST